MSIQQTLLPLFLLILSPTAVTALPSDSSYYSRTTRDAESSYNSARRTITGSAIALIVIFSLFGLAVIGSGFFFCCILVRNKKRRARQAEEVKAANETAAARRGAYAAAPQYDEEEALRPYQYGGQMAELSSQEVSEVDGGVAVQRPVEADSRPRGPGELP